MDLDNDVRTTKRDPRNVSALGRWKLAGPVFRRLWTKVHQRSGMLSLALVLGPWLSLRTKLQSLLLALNFKSLVESFCHNRLVV